MTALRYEKELIGPYHTDYNVKKNWLNQIIWINMFI